MANNTNKFVESRLAAKRGTPVTLNDMDFSIFALLKVAITKKLSLNTVNSNTLLEAHKG